MEYHLNIQEHSIQNHCHKKYNNQNALNAKGSALFEDLIFLNEIQRKGKLNYNHWLHITTGAVF